MNPGLTMLEIEVETQNGEKYWFGIDREKTVVLVPGEYTYYPLISSGPITVGLELRGKYKKRSDEYITFESAKVKNIVAKFTLNRLIAK